MTTEQVPSLDSRPPLSAGSVALRLIAIAGVVSIILGAFAFLNGSLTPGELTPPRFVDGMEQVSGVHPGYRRNHAKGVCASGYFESNGNGTHLSRSVVFQSGRTQVVARFSLGVGDPHAADTSDAIRGLGLSFSLPGGEEWRTAMINLPVFPFSTPQSFYDRMIATQLNPKTTQPDPAKVAAFLKQHPETVHALEIIKSAPQSSSFAESTFNSLNAFGFVNAAGVTTAVRGQWCR